MSGDEESPGGLWQRLRSALRRAFTTPLFGTSHADWRGDLAEAHLPPDVNGRVECIIKRTRLWNREKRVVANDLCLQVLSDLDAGRTADEILAGLGPPRKLARSYRKQLRRQRHWVWRAIERGCLAFNGLLALVGVVVALIYGYHYARFRSAKPSVRVDYVAQFNAHALSIPESQRGWPYFEQAMRLIEPIPEIHDADDSGCGYLSEVNADHPDWPKVVAYLNRNENALELARRAALMDTFGFLAFESFDDPSNEDNWLRTVAFFAPGYGKPGGSTPLANYLLPQERALFEFAQLFGMHAEMIARAGDAEQVIDDLRAMLGLSRAGTEPALIRIQSFAFSIFDMTASRIGQLLHTSSELFTDEQLRLISDLLDGALGGGEPRFRLNDETLVFEDLLQHVYSDNGHGNGIITPEGMAYLFASRPRPASKTAPSQGQSGMSTFEMSAFSFFIGDRRTMSDLHHRVMQTARDETAKPLWKRVIRFDADLLDERLGSFLRITRYPIARSFIPPLIRLDRSRELVLNRRDAMLAAIAIELYKRRNGMYPNQLAELVPDFLPQVPIDRFDGGPLKYTLRPDGTPVLYSVGADLDDDGGAVPTGRYHNRDARDWLGSSEEVARLKRERTGKVPDGDWVLWPPVSD